MMNENEKDELIRTLQIQIQNIKSFGPTVRRVDPEEIESLGKFINELHAKINTQQLELKTKDEIIYNLSVGMNNAR